LSAIIANRIHKNFSKDAGTLIEKLIVKSLEIITQKI